MKRNRKVMLMGCMLGLAGLASCTDGYESEPVENFTLDYVFSPTDSVGTCVLAMATQPNSLRCCLGAYHTEYLFSAIVCVQHTF